MKGHQQVIDKLNELLTSELTSIDTYFVHSRVLQRLGYHKLYEQLDHEMSDEQNHATKIIERILFLEGTPDLSKRLSFKVERSVKTIFETDLKFELDVRRILIECMDICLKVKDYVTYEVLEPLLKDTEQDHIDWLETQISIIKKIGEERYLAEKL